MRKQAVTKFNLTTCCKKMMVSRLRFALDGIVDRFQKFQNKLLYQFMTSQDIKRIFPYTAIWINLIRSYDILCTESGLKDLQKKGI